MGEILDVQLSCCILHKKRIISALKPLSSGEKLIHSGNTETVKDQIQRVLKAENREIIEVNDENGTTRITVQKI